MDEQAKPVGDIEAEVSTLVVVKAERHDCYFCGHSGATVQRMRTGMWYHDRCLPNEAVAGGSIESDFTAIAAEQAESALAKARRVRRAAVNRLIDMIRIEQLNLSGPNDRTDVEELIHDTIMMALDRYVEARPKATPGKMSMALDTLEKMRAAGGEVKWPPHRRRVWFP